MFSIFRITGIILSGAPAIASKRTHPVNLVAVMLLLGGTLSAMDTEVGQSVRIYKEVDGMSLKVDIFEMPRGNKQESRPAMAFFHGGGWVFGERSEFHEACLRYAKLGMVTFSFEYRLSINADGTFPHPDITPVESVKDARSAMRWIREHAVEFGIDPDRIVACGQSAGGQLALSTALIDGVNESSDKMEISTVPSALVLYSSSVNMVEAWADMLLGERRQEIWSISPHHNLKRGMPPAIQFHGELDDQVPFRVVRQFRNSAVKLGNQYELVSYEGRKHYLGDGDPQYGRYFDEEILKKTDAFLRRQGILE